MSGYEGSAYVCCSSSSTVVVAVVVEAVVVAVVVLVVQGRMGYARVGKRRECYASDIGVWCGRLMGRSIG